MVVARGLDAHENDPFKGFKVTTPGFARIAAAIASLGLPAVIVQEGGYLLQTRSEDDKRTVTLRLTDRGKKVRVRVAKLFEKQATALEPTASVRADDLSQLNKTVSRLERFWSDQIRYRL